MGIAIDKITHSPTEDVFYSWSTQAGLLFMVLLYWVIPLLQKGSDWNPVVPGLSASAKSNVFDHLTADRNSPAASVVLLSPVIAFIFSKSIWALTNVQWGTFLISGSALYAVTALLQWKTRKRGEPVALHVSGAIVMLTLSLFYLLDGDQLFFALAMEATLLNLAGSKLKHPAIVYAGAFVFAWIGLWFITRILEKPLGDPIFNWNAAVNFLTILLAAFSTMQTQSRDIARAYGLYSYLGFLALLLKEISPLANGDGLVSIAWGIMGGLTLWAGLRWKHLDIFKIGFITLILVAAKLPLIDLAHLDVIWRILTFLGFGGAFLLISFWMKDQWPSQSAGFTPSPSD